MSSNKKHRVLVVDDEPDIHALTKLSLKGLRYEGRRIEFAFASSGEEAVEEMRAHPETAVILLDVVMESETAGLDACRKIRDELGNQFVRILLRTGQPGVAPEKKAIDDYDLDGYLPKAELTTTRLYAAVRTAIKAFCELKNLERHRSLLRFIHDSVAALHSFEPLGNTLQSLLTTASQAAQASFGVLKLTTLEGDGDLRSFFLHLSDEDDERCEQLAEELARKVAGELQKEETRSSKLVATEDGIYVPLVLHRGLGRGWIYLSGCRSDVLLEQVLPVLAAHAGNALYSSVAQGMLEDREGPLFDTMEI